MKTQKTLILVSITSLIGLALTGCNSNVRHAIGIKKTAPDAFKVVSNPPLSLPPNFDLRPPKLGAASLHHSDIVVEAQQLVFEVPQKRTKKQTTNPTKGEYALLKQADAFEKDHNIREVLDEELRLAELEKKEQGFFTRMIDYTSGNPQNDTDPVINAGKEKQRIEEKKQQGELLDGSDVPVASNSSESGFFGRILGL